VTTPTRLAMLVVGVHLVVRAWLILPAEYWQDDFVVLRISRQGPPTFDSVMRSGNGHLSPGTYLVGWVLAQFPGSFLPAALLLLGLQALASVILWLMLRRAVGNRMSAVVGLSLALFTPLMFSTVTWWAAGLVMLVLHLAMGICGYCHLRFLESRSWWWVAGSVSGLLLGLVFVEKALFITIFLVVLTVLVTDAGGRRTTVALLRLWMVWIVYAVFAGAYLVVYLRYAGVGAGNARTVSAAAELARYQVADVFGRGLVGGPWGTVIPATGQWLPMSATVLAVLVQIFVAVAVLAYRVSGARSVVAWVALVLYMGVNVALTVRGRGLFAGYVQLDPRYVCDVIPVAAVCLAVMFTPRPGRAPRYPVWVNRQAVVFAGVAILLLFNSSMVTAGHIGSPLHHRQVTSYVENARRSLQNDPRAVLFDGFVPGTIMIGAFPDQEKRVSSVLDAYDVHAQYDKPSSNMKVLDDNGVAWPITLLFPQTGVIKHRKGCGVAVQPGRPAFVQLNQLIPAGQWVMRVDYFTATSSVLNVTTAGDAQPVGFLAGPRSVFLPVESDGTVPYVEFESSEPSGVVCVTGLTVGFPAPQTS
jgi:hypothetical protein